MSLTVGREGDGDPCPDCGATATYRMPAAAAHSRCLHCGNSREIGGGQRGGISVLRAENDRLRAENEGLKARVREGIEGLCSAAMGARWDYEERGRLAADLDRLRRENDRLAALVGERERD